jgi:hypothetical protein
MDRKRAGYLTGGEQVIKQEESRSLDKRRTSYWAGGEQLVGR